MTVLVTLIKSSKRFFFVKKKQKTFLVWGTGVETGTGSEE